MRRSLEVPDEMQQPPAILHDDVKRELGDERVLWAGVPGAWPLAKKRLGNAALGLVLLVMVIGFTVIFSLQAPKVGFDGIFPSMGLFFGAGAVLMILSPLFAAWLAGRTYFAVTERRAMILEKAWRVKIHSFDASGFGGYERVSSGSAAGDILFQRNIERRGKGTRIEEVGFFGLQDFAPAEKALDAMMSRARRA